MRTATILAVVLPLGLGAYAGVGTNPQDTRSRPQESSGDMQEAMRDWSVVMTPGAEHEQLQQLVGQWDTVTHVWMQGPETPAQESRGAATFTSILGGRFVKEETKGSMMGMPFEGLGLLGFDRYKKVFTSVWVDSMGTATYTSSGSFDRTGRVLSMYGQMDEPVLGVHDRTVLYRTTFLDGNHVRFEVFDLFEGPDHKLLEVEYLRREPTATR